MWNKHHRAMARNNRELQRIHNQRFIASNKLVHQHASRNMWYSSTLVSLTNIVDYQENLNQLWMVLILSYNMLIATDFLGIQPDCLIGCLHTLMSRNNSMTQMAMCTQFPNADRANHGP
jgi:hypothetical protein